MYQDGLKLKGTDLSHTKIWSWKDLKEHRGKGRGRLKSLEVLGVCKNDLPPTIKNNLGIVVSLNRFQ